MGLFGKPADDVRPGDGTADDHRVCAALYRLRSILQAIDPALSDESSLASYGVEPARVVLRMSAPAS